MQDDKNLQMEVALDYQLNVWNWLIVTGSRTIGGKKNKATSTLLYSHLVSGFLYSALGFRDYKTSEYKGNAVDFAKGGKNLQDLFGFADPDFGEWQKRIDFDKWIQVKNWNRWLEKHENYKKDE